MSTRSWPLFTWNWNRMSSRNKPFAFWRFGLFFFSYRILDCAPPPPLTPPTHTHPYWRLSMKHNCNLQDLLSRSLAVRIFALAELSAFGLQSCSEHFLCISCLQRRWVACCTEIWKFLVTPFQAWTSWPLESHCWSMCFFCLGRFFFFLFLKSPLACWLGKRRFCVTVGPDLGLLGCKVKAWRCFPGC